MAIYHLSAKLITRSSGRSATAAAAYRAGERIHDDRTGKVFDYSRKREVSFRHVYVPRGAPEWAKNRSLLWNAVEKAEIRKDSQVAREVEVALPLELTPNQQVILLERFVQAQFTVKGMVADVCIHAKKGNPHAHILLTTRSLQANGFGPKCREWNSKDMLEEIRREWAVQFNRRLSVACKPDRIDHRTLKAQGIDRVPTIHLGPTRHAMAKKGMVFPQQELNSLLKENNMKNEKSASKLQPTPPETLEVLKFVDEGVSRVSDVSNHKSTFVAPLFIGSDNPVHQRHYLEALMARQYLPALLQILQELFPINHPSTLPVVDEVQTEIGFAYRIQLSTGAVYDHGSQMKVENGTDEEIAVALRLAKEKGWTGLQLTGSNEFKEKVFMEAVVSGLFALDQIKGYMPTKANMEVIRDVLRHRQQEPAQVIRRHQIYVEGEETSTQGQQSTKPRLKF